LLIGEPLDDHLANPLTDVVSDTQHPAAMWTAVDFGAVVPAPKGKGDAFASALVDVMPAASSRSNSGSGRPAISLAR
jgi:hypothetical protein